ncbi:hypothetical protein CYMTET_25357 [Cymbomonas tetramitiformis]|uniref:Uncharacterized protein n=1 Tax=Cymbomonas tetramitiformis TaxID=36881 RepID=A0AAE0KZ11_9CHLO|nr:hypothetical protein CYMTET_25357 [Cymbomonas tetramitiformis]
MSFPLTIESVLGVTAPVFLSSTGETPITLEDPPTIRTARQGHTLSSTEGKASFAQKLAILGRPWSRSSASLVQSTWKAF